jgi:hypothetical protein
VHTTVAIRREMGLNRSKLFRFFGTILVTYPEPKEGMNEAQ